MAYNERLEEVTRIIQRRKRVSVPELSERFGISEVTIRKDLSLLEERGILVRTHGGAILAEDRDMVDLLRRRTPEYESSKKAIALQASNLLSDGMNIIIDTGSTTLAFANEVSRFSLRAVTNSLEIGYRLARCDDINLNIIGGSLRHPTMAMIGPIALTSLANLNVDCAFMGASGFSEGRGFSCTNVIESQVKESMMKCATRVVVLADSTKYKKDSFCSYAQLDEADLLITDENLPDEAASRFCDMGIEVIRAPLGDKDLKTDANRA
jgi:DeoR family transcriptional regulator, fructose operon transcriptional repressor